MGALRMAAHAAKSAQRGQVKIAPADAAKLQARAAHLAQTLQTLREQLVRKELSEKVEEAESVDVPEVPATTRNPDRPADLSEMVGQSDVVMMLRLAIAGAQLRGEQIGNVLVTGSPGLGKSSLAQVVAAELGVPMISTTGMLLRKASDVISLLMSVEGAAVLFVEEAHQISSAAATVLYQVAEDHAVDMLCGTGPDVSATTKPLPGLVLVMATTHPGKLSQSLRDRMDIQLTMQDYSDDEIATIVRRFWKSRGVSFFKGEDLELSRRSRGIPRKALTLAGYCLNYIAVNDQKTITTGTANAACSVYGVDSRGHDHVDRQILGALTGPFAAKAAGLDNLSAFLNVEPSTIEAQERFLIQQGLVIRTGRGRLATPAAYELMRA